MGMGVLNQNFGTVAPSNMNIQGTYSIRYQVTTVDEPSFNKQGSSQKPIPIKLISITAMNEYCYKSLEELRIEDYRIKKSGVIPQMQPAAQNMGMINSQNFGAPNTGQTLFGQPQQQNQQSTGLFGSGMGNTQQSSGGLFGSNTQSGGLFGKPAGPANQQTGMGLFGSNTTANMGTGLNVNQQQHGGLFGQTNTQPNIFGQNTVQQQKPATGGLFGNTSNTQQPTSSLFGSQTATTQPQSSGVFAGVTNINQQSSSGLFGNQQQNTSLFSGMSNTQQPTSNLFGGTTATGQQPSSSLFGGVSNTNQQPTSSLFGGTTATAQQPSSGLFGSTTTQPQNTSLFGAQQGSSSLFGNQQGSTSLFGGVSNTSQQPSTSFFAGQSGVSNNQQQPTTSLFGGLSSTQQTSGSLFGGQKSTSTLFGQTAPQPQMGTSSLFGGDANKTGLFLNTPSAHPTDLASLQAAQMVKGAANAYLDLINVGKKSIEEVLDDIQKDYLEEQFNNSFKKIQSKSYNLYNEEFKRFYPETLPFDILNKYTDYNYLEKEDKKLTYYRTAADFSYMDSFLKSKRVGLGSSKRFDLLEPSELERNKAYSTNTNIFKQMQLSKEREMMRNLHIKPEELERNYRNLERFRNEIYRDNTRKISDLYDKNYRTNLELRKSHSYDPILSGESSSKFLNNLESGVNNLLLERKSDQSDFRDNYIINVVLQDPIKFSTKITIMKNKTVCSLKKIIADELSQKNPSLFRKLNEDNFFLFKNYAIIRENCDIETAKISNGDTIYILLNERLEKIKMKEDQLNEEVNEASGIPSQRKDSANYKISEIRKKKSHSTTAKNKEKEQNKNDLAPLELLPRIERKKYITNPSYSEICRMNLTQLENVNNFTIYNDYGKIIFDGITDLTGLNIDQIVHIGEGEISLYKSENLLVTPEVGKELNKPATIYMNNLHPENVCEDYDEKQDYGKLLASLEDMCREKGVNFFCFYLLILFVIVIIKIY